MKKWKLWKVYSHKNFELLQKSLRFQCDSVKCDQNGKSFLDLIKILTALKIEVMEILFYVSLSLWSKNYILILRFFKFIE